MWDVTEAEKVDVSAVASSGNLVMLVPCGALPTAAVASSGTGPSLQHLAGVQERPILGEVATGVLPRARARP